MLALISIVLMIFWRIFYASTEQKTLGRIRGKKGYQWKKVMTGEEVCSMLAKNGWVHDGGEGSHRKYTKNDYHCTVPCHSKDLPIGTYKSIQKQVKRAEEANEDS